MVFGDKNNNKFYKATLFKGGKVDTNWGRVGASGQSKSYTFDDDEAEKFFNKKLSEKERKGYKEIEVLDEGETQVQNDLEDVALQQINFDKKNDDIKAFILRLVENNIHQITSGYNITVNKKTGAIETPLGILSQATIDEGKTALDTLQREIHRKKNIIRLNEQYYSRIPKIYRHIEDVLIDNHNKIKEAKEYCEQLEQTLNFYTPKKSVVGQVFDLEIDTLNKGHTFSKIENYFRGTKNRHHGQLCSYHINHIYEIDIKNVSDSYNKCKISNEKLLWHGTKVANMLSILKSGLVLPDNLATIETTGTMFGTGLYFADQSTKSLQYCAGVAPGQYSRYGDNMLFMFLATVRMGNEYIPNGPNGNLHQTILNNPYDSTFARANRSGVLNNEFIVYNTDQVNLTHILELIN